MVSKKLDRFHEDFSKLEMTEDRLIDTLKQRSIALKSGGNTGKFDYLLRNDVESAKDDLKNLEKLVFIYEYEQHKNPEINAKER